MLRRVLSRWRRGFHPAHLLAHLLHLTAHFPHLLAEVVSRRGTALDLGIAAALIGLALLHLAALGFLGALHFGGNPADFLTRLLRVLRVTGGLQVLGRLFEVHQAHRWRRAVLAPGSGVRSSGWRAIGLARSFRIRLPSLGGASGLFHLRLPEPLRQAFRLIVFAGGVEIADPLADSLAADHSRPGLGFSLGFRRIGCRPFRRRRWRRSFLLRLKAEGSE